MEALADKFSRYWEQNKETIIPLSVSVFLSALFSYFVFIIQHQGLPDGVIEGLYYYRNADWHLCCGRWAVRYLNLLIGGNVVMPLVIVAVSCAAVVVMTMLLKRLFGLKNKFLLCILGALFCVSPSYIVCLTYPHVALSFMFGFFFSVLYFYFGTVKTDYKKLYAFLSVFSLAVSLGLYQSYLGSAVFLVLLMAFFDLGDLPGREFRTKYLHLLLYGVAGSLFDVLIYKCGLAFRHFTAANRVTMFSAKSIIASLPQSVLASYKIFLKYFYDDILSRKYFYILLFFIGSFLLFFYLLQERKKPAVTAGRLIILALFPIGMNIIQILIPYFTVYLLMQQHYVLIFLLPFILYERQEKNSLVSGVLSLVEIVLLSTYVISANATYMSIRASYDALNTQTQMILQDVYHLDGYEPNVTKIVMVGFPSERVPQQNLEIYQDAIGLYNNQAFWEDYNGVTLSRYHYLLTYFGVDAGVLTNEEYVSAAFSEEFNEMPVWPKEGSVRMINGLAVVKLTEEPIYPPY